MATKNNRKSFKERVKNLIWTEGTYSEITPSSGTIIRKHPDEIIKVQESIRHSRHLTKSN